METYLKNTESVSLFSNTNLENSRERVSGHLLTLYLVGIGVGCRLFYPEAFQSLYSKISLRHHAFFLLINFSISVPYGFGRQHFNKPKFIKGYTVDVAYSAASNTNYVNIMMTDIEIQSGSIFIDGDFSDWEAVDVSKVSARFPMQR